VKKKPVALPEKRKYASLIMRRMKAMYPEATCELTYANAFELAVAAILSAQCTDKRVNLVTPPLFKKYKTVKDWAEIPHEVLEKEIHSTGFYRNKTKSILGLANKLLDQYNGMLPQTLDELITLPGIGRKTANVLLISAFNKPGITVDTHCKRVSFRLGLTRSTNPDVIEMDLKALLPSKNWATWSHCIVWHGRYTCLARKPRCSECNMNDICPHIF